MVTRAVEHNFPRKLHSIITHVHGLCRKAPTAAPGRLWPFISGFLSTLCSHSAIVGTQIVRKQTTSDSDETVLQTTKHIQLELHPDLDALVAESNSEDVIG